MLRVRPRLRFGNGFVGLATGALLLQAAACSRVPAASVVSRVTSPDGENQAIVARNPIGATAANGAALCVYDQYVATGGGRDPTHVASYALPCSEPPPKAVWRAYNADGRSFDVHLLDATGRELGAADRTWQLATGF